MTSIPSSIPKIARLASEVDDHEPTPQKIDRMVTEGRATRDPAVEELRAAPRMSIAELNERDSDEILRRMTPYHPTDTRGPVTQFLDLLDLPRNTIASAVAPGLARKKKAEGETGLAGMGKVYFSDILGELGMRPGIARGVLGFVGDVALDPLTYAGPPGWGAKLSAAGGRTVRVGAQGRRAIKAGIEALGKGGEIADPILKNLYHESVIPRLVADATPAQKAAAFSEATFGKRATGIKERLKKGEIFELQGSGGEIADSTLRARREGADAAKDFLGRYGEGVPLSAEELAGKAGLGPRLTPKGIAFGNGQTAIAHLPFTEYGIYGPGFTQAGRSRLAQRAGAMALAGASPDAMRVLGFDAKTAEMGKLADEAKEWSDRHVAEADYKGPPSVADVKNDRDKYFFHGTPDEDAARSIENEGLTMGGLSGIASDAHEYALSPNGFVLAFRRGDVAPNLPKGALNDVSLAAQHGYKPIKPAAVFRQSEFGEPIPLGHRSAEEGIGIEPDMFVPPGPTPDLAEGMSIADFDAASGLHARRIRADYARGRMAQIRDRMDALEQESSELARSFTQSDNLGVSDLLAVNDRLKATRAMRDKVHADLDEIPIFESLKVKPITGDALRSLRDDKLAEITASAKAELNIPALESELAAASRYEAPTRLGAMDPLDVTDQLEAARAALPAKIEELKAANVKQISTGLLNMTDAEIEAMASRVDALHRKYEAIANLEDATKGALVASLDSDSRVAADVSRYLLGIDNDMLRTSPMRGVNQAMREILGRDNDSGIGMGARMANASDGYMRRVIGDRRSTLDRVRRAVTNSIESGSPYETAAVVRDVVGDAALPIIKQLGLKTNDQLDRFWTLVHTRMLQKIGELTPERVLDRVAEGGKWVESPLARKARQVSEAGWLGKAVDPDRFKNLMPSIDKLSDSILDHYKLLGADLGEGAIDAYAPNRLTPLALQEAARKRRAGFNVAGDRSYAASAAAEPFEKPRSMLVYQWETPDGAAHQLDDIDFDYLANWREPDGTWNRAYAELDPDYQADIAKIGEEVDSWRATHPGIDDAARRQYHGKLADPFYLNERERLRSIVGGSKVADELFSTNALYLLAKRQSEQFTQKAAQSFGKIKDDLSLKLATEVARREDLGPMGTKIEFRGGGSGVIVKGGDGKASVQIGDTIYRPLKIGLDEMREPGLMQSVLDARDLTRYYPEQFAEMVERAFKAGRSPSDLEGIAKAAEKATGIWKALTLARPSWITFNLLGLAWQTAMGRVPLESLVKHFPDAMRATMSKGDLAALSKNVTLAGQSKSLGEIALEGHNTWGGGGFYGEALSQAKGTRENVYGPTLRPKPDDWSGRIADYWEQFKGYPASLRTEFGKRERIFARGFAVDRATTAAEKLNIAGKQLYDEAFIRRFFGPWAKMNAVLEESWRTAAYMAMLDQGWSPLAAGQHVRETFYDFADFTDAERSVRRYAVPFLSWMRNNASYQMRNVLSNPKWAAMFPKIKEGIEESIAGENQVPEHMRPSWMREQLAVQLGSDPSSRSALNIGSAINPEPVYNIPSAVMGGEGVMNTLRWFMSQTNPIIQSGYALASGHDLYTGRQISARPEEGDLSVADYVGGQIMPIREFVPTGLRTPAGIKAFDRGVGAGVGRLAFGGRFQDFSTERTESARQRDLDERADGIKKYIRLAEREGNQDASLRGRARLMALYQDAESSGLRVPKWSRKQAK